MKQKLPGVFILYLVVCTSCWLANEVQSHQERNVYNLEDECKPRVLTPNQNSGDCQKLSSSQCLCTLNGNCKYNPQTQQCSETKDCTVYDFKARECRRNSCYYDCATGTCSSNQGSSSECSVDMECHSECNDICVCKGNGCEFDMLSRTCKPTRHIECAPESFGKLNCVRKNGIYHHTNTYCKSTKESGECYIEEVVLAVNFNGPNNTDDLGIDYVSAMHIPYDDPYDLLRPYKVDVKGFDTDSILFGSGIFGSPEKRDPNRCVTFTVPLCQEGNYELNVKTLELSEVLTGEKLFNVMLNDVYVFPEVDVAKLAGGPYRPVELIFQFLVEDETIIVNGDKPIPIKCNKVKLSFCYGLCTFTQGSFQVAAFSLTRLSNKVMTESNLGCAENHKSDWECEMANCKYNDTSKTCFTRKASLCKSDKLCGFFDQAARYPCFTYADLPLKQKGCSFRQGEMRMQVAFAIDVTESMEKNLLQNAFSGKLPDIKDTLNIIHPDTEFAFTVHANWPDNAYDQTAPPDANPERCYIRIEKFTTDVLKIQTQASMVQTINRPVKGADEEGTLPAVAFAAVDENLGWIRSRYDSTGKRVFRFIVAITDDDSTFHLPFKNNRKPFRGNGSDSCETSFPPSYPICRKVFFEKEMNVIGIYKDLDTKNIYDKHFENIGAPHCSHVYQNFDIFQSGVVGMISDCIRRLSQCICDDLQCSKTKL